jgi:hypothetical protein
MHHCAHALLSLWGAAARQAIGSNAEGRLGPAPAGLMLAQGALCAIVYGLTSRRTVECPPQPAAAGCADPLAAGAGGRRGLLLGGTALMATIAFSAQRYFEISETEKP